ncbi:hypothetical protein IFR09_20345 [Pseudomonas syringae]|nr:hypothetical protein [Pseudomonas syringae]MBD8576919.1 hypothetical protein [Pseudomonas syringae]MBD8792048.1 hypothetical protein [Pseudomonas syringae]MBD8801272.1 hypothetical protein [Pseudomonas syringae]MBD8813513.1 hypothetical protein [Pseudomonas syringae]
MSIQGALSRARLFPTFLGASLLVLGVVQIIAGYQLVSLGGSCYFVLSGLGLAACGVLLLLALRMAVWLFSLCLSLCTVWSLWDAGLDRQQLMPRLFIWFLIGLVLLAPLARQGLRPMRRPFSLMHLMVALVLAGVSLDPLAQIRQYHSGYRELATLFVPRLDVLPLAVEATAVRAPEG